MAVGVRESIKIDTTIQISIKQIRNLGIQKLAESKGAFKQLCIYKDTFIKDNESAWHNNLFVIDAYCIITCFNH